MMPYFELEINFSKNKVPSITSIVEEVERVSGLCVELKKSELKWVNEEAQGFEILNDPSGNYFTIVLEPNVIAIIPKSSDLGYFEGVLTNVLVKKFKGEVSYEIFLPPWTEEAWKGDKWWKKCEKKPSKSTFKKIKLFYQFIRDCIKGS